MPEKITYPLLLACAFILLVLAGTLFVRNFEKLKGGQGFRVRQSHLPIMTVDQIQGWMTFDYLNRTFMLPNDYLKDALSITSTKYPKITIKRASIISGTSVSDVVSHIKESIKNYSPAMKNNTQ